MCLGSVFSLALAVFSFVNIFFLPSRSPPAPPVQSETIKSESVWTFAGLSCHPCPLLSQTFWLQQALKSFLISSLSFQIFSAQGAELLPRPRL